MAVNPEVKKRCILKKHMRAGDNNSIIFDYQGGPNSIIFDYEGGAKFD